MAPPTVLLPLHPPRVPPPPLLAPQRLIPRPPAPSSIPGLSDRRHKSGGSEGYTWRAPTGCPRSPRLLPLPPAAASAPRRPRARLPPSSPPRQMELRVPSTGTCAGARVRVRVSGSLSTATCTRLTWRCWPRLPRPGHACHTRATPVPAHIPTLTPTPLMGSRTGGSLGCVGLPVTGSGIQPLLGLPTLTPTPIVGS